MLAFRAIRKQQRQDAPYNIILALYQSNCSLLYSHLSTLPFPSISAIAVAIAQLLRGPNIHSLPAGNRGLAPVHAVEVAGRAARVADFRDAEGVIWKGKMAIVSKRVGRLK